MLRLSEPTVPIVPRQVPIPTTGSVHRAVASYAGRLARRRVTRRGFGPSTPDALRPTEVVL
jgi:hypothetical protein